MTDVMRAFAIGGLFVVGLLACAALSAPGDDGAGGGRAAPPSGPTPLVVPGIENCYRLGPKLFSGAQPEGDAAFAALARLGVKTLITVDGGPPDLERAGRFGMRYVHLPVGYDGIADEQALRLVKAARDLPGPVFVHCHHGKHRGPTAAALCAIAVERWDRARARAWLSQAGTDPKYAGLFETVERFVPPTGPRLDRVPDSELPESAPVPDLVETMIEVDGRWDRLKALPAQAYRPPADLPGFTAADEATLLAEAFREAARLKEAAARGAAFRAALTDAARDADTLAAALRSLAAAPMLAARRQELTTAISRIDNACKACHGRARDRTRRPQP